MTKSSKEAAPGIASLSISGIREAQRHLRQACPVMAQLIVAHGRCPLAEREYQPFQTLVNSIISQLISVKAAAAIKQRVQAIAPHLAPAEFLSAPPEALRGAGLSASKTRYVLGLAERVAEGKLDFSVIAGLADDAAIVELVKIPGIGRWTAEMFLIFGLRRSDVLSLGDAGLQRACRLLFPDQSLADVSARWRPYRSVACWYLWQSLRNG